MKIFKILIFLIGLSVVAAFWLDYRRSRSGHSSKEDILPVATFCENLHEGILQWSATVRLPKTIAEKNLLDPEKAVREQIKYLDGLEHFAKYEEPRLILLHDLSITINSVKVGNDAEAIIFYTAEKPVSYCTKTGEELKTLNLSLPFNPYSAFDLVSVDFRKTLSFHGETLKTNPCADSEIVIENSPDHYWYTWQPQARGVDAFGEAFDCRTVLKAGTDYQTVEAHILEQPVRQKKNRFQPMMDSPNWRISLVFGFVSGQQNEKTLRDAKKFFAAHPNLGSSVFEDKRTQDAAVWAVIDFFEQLKKIADVADYRVENRDDHLRFSAQAKLKASQRNTKVEIFLGPTGTEARAEKNFLAEAMRSSQMLFYIGHSGAGSRIDWNSLQPQFPEQQPYQILGVIGCYSTEYFDPVYIDFRQSKGLETVFLLTDFSGYRFLLPLGLLSYLDHYQKADSLSLLDNFSNYLESGEKVLVRFSARNF